MTSAELVENDGIHENFVRSGSTGCTHSGSLMYVCVLEHWHNDSNVPTYPARSNTHT